MTLQAPIVPAGSRAMASLAGWIAVAVFAALVACLYALSWNSEAAGFLSDDGVYLLMADGFSPYRPSDSALSQYVLRQSLFPPGYPLLLAALGAGSEHLLWAHVITTSCLVLALVVFAAWVWSQTRDRVACAGLVLVFGLMPGIVLHNLEILSEFPYALFSLAALWLADRDSGTRSANAFRVAVCVGLAVLTRSAGWSMVPAFAVWLYGRPIAGRLKWLALVVLPSACWVFYKSQIVGSRGGYDQFWLWLWQQLQTSGFAEFVPRFLESQASAIWQGLLANLDLRPTQITNAMLAVVLLTGIHPWWRRLRQLRLDAWYLLVGFTMILLYPFPSFFQRLLLPWVPILFFYFYLGVGEMTAGWGKVHGRPALAYAAVAALLLTFVPSLGFMASRWAEPVAPELSVWKHTRYWYRFDSQQQILADVAFRQGLIQVSRDVAQWVAPGECVFAVHTSISMLYSRRVFQQPPPPSRIASWWPQAAQVCGYLLVVPTPGTIGGESVLGFYPIDAIPADSVETVHAWQGASAQGMPSTLLLRPKPSSLARSAMDPSSTMHGDDDAIAPFDAARSIQRDGSSW